jgi:hypothetical protein
VPSCHQCSTQSSGHRSSRSCRCGLVQAGGEYRDWFIETVYKAVKVSPRYTVLLEEIASGSTAGESDTASEGHPLKSVGPKAETFPSTEPPDPPAEEFTPLAESAIASGDGAGSLDPRSSTARDLAPTGATERAAMVDDFLFRCNQEPGLSEELIRKHIWLSARHKGPRQFQYWQEVSPRATVADERNFGGIIRMAPAEFVELLRKRGLIAPKP